MRPSRILVRATAVASAIVLAACAGRDVTAPTPAATDGTHLLVPGDGPSRDVTPDGQPIVRIGVVQSASTITLGSAADYVVRDKGTGLSVFTGSAGSVRVVLQSVGEARYHLQVMCASLASVQARKDAAEAEGYPTLAEFYAAGNCTRLYIGDFAIAGTFGVRTAFKNELVAKGLAQSDAFWRSITPVGGTVYAVTSGSVTKQVNNPVTITSSDGIITINGARYRGLGEARVNSLATLAGINELPLEQYLYGVVPRELGPIAYPEMEAQKAQAIVARTYAISGLGKRSADGYDLRATTDDQVYGGYGSEYALSNQAVDETRGRVVTYEGHLISTLYFSTSGGHTADNEEAFNGSPAAYLRGVPDAERGKSFEHVPTLEVFMSHANPMSLRAAKEGDYESDWSRYHRWSFEWSAAEISSIVSAWAGQDVGRVLEINALERGPSGRVLELEYVTDAGRFYAYKDGIRAALKYLNASNVATNLPSTLFYVEPTLDRKTKELTGFVAYGGGFGHGVGLSQTGAVGMAQKGHTVDEILHHYYQGVELASRY